MNKKVKYRLEYARGSVFDKWHFLEFADSIEDARKLMSDHIAACMDRDDRGFEHCWTALQYEAEHADLNDVVSFDETAWRIVEDDE